MALALARFIFGFSVSWIAAAILIAATLVCIRLISIVVHAFDNEHTENFAGGLCVLLVAIGALVALYASANGLHDFIGTSSWVGNTPNWLAGGNNLSPAAVLGALVGLAVLGGIPMMLDRRLNPTALVDAPKKAVAEARIKSAAAKSATAKSAAAKAASQTMMRPKGSRVPGFGWIALFLLLMGAAVFVFALSLDPHTMEQNRAILLPGNGEERAARARFVYVAAVSLLGGSGVFFVLWIFWRRKP